MKYGSGYRSAGGDTVRIKCKVCHSSGTVMVVESTRLCLLYKWFYGLAHTMASFVLVAVVELFIHGTSSTLLFSKFFKDLWFRYSMFLPRVVQPNAYLSCITVMLQAVDE